MLQTVDADAKMATGCLLACGSSYFSAAAADAATDSAMDLAAMTTVCGSSYFSAAVADSAAMDADANLA